MRLFLDLRPLNTISTGCDIALLSFTKNHNHVYTKKVPNGTRAWRPDVRCIDTALYGGFLMRSDGVAFQHLIASFLTTELVGSRKTGRLLTRSANLQVLSPRLAA